ncbi:hypothetical protein [Microbacterium maritypicum]
MSMIILNSAIDRLQAGPAKKKTSYNQRVDAIRDNRSLSPEGKSQQIATLYAAGKKRLDDMHAKERSAIASERAALERSIFGSIVTDPSSVIAYRDAQDRATQLREEDSDRASDMLRSATLSNDSTLAAAVLGCGVTLSASPFGVTPRWQRVVDLYAAENPSPRHRTHRTAEHQPVREATGNGCIQGLARNVLARHAARTPRAERDLEREARTVDTVPHRSFRHLAAVVLSMSISTPKTDTRERRHDVAHDPYIAPKQGGTHPNPPLAMHSLGIRPPSPRGFSTFHP